MGPSGSGKSTMLNLIAGLDGDQRHGARAGSDIGRMSDGERPTGVPRTLGSCSNIYNLMPVLSALENVELPLLLAKLPRPTQEAGAAGAQGRGLEDRMNHFPRQLSGGQEQRVTIARAIVTDRRYIVADEPTGIWIVRAPTRS